MRARGYITADARNQTEYGTVRSYIAVGVSENDVGLNTAANQFSANRAFIQWAGFTFGRAQSFFDFYSVPATSYWGAFPASDTGDPGWFIDGLHGAIRQRLLGDDLAEERRVTQIIGMRVPGCNCVLSWYVHCDRWLRGSRVQVLAVATLVRAATVASRLPTLSATCASTKHGVRPRSWAPCTRSICATTDTCAARTADTGPAMRTDKLGWVVGAGLKLNTPWLFNWLGSGVGDYFQAQVNYTEGALRYVFQTPNTNWGKVNEWRSLWCTERCGRRRHASGCRCCRPALNLTTAWNVNAAYEHFWSPRWRTSLYGGYAAVSYGSAANGTLCTAIGGAGVTPMVHRRRRGYRRSGLQHELEHLVGRFTHPVERHQGLLHGRGRAVLEAGRRIVG